MSRSNSSSGLAQASFAVLLAVFVIPSRPVAAQSAGTGRPLPMVGAPAAPPPVPPEVVSRNVEGGVTVRAIRISELLEIDGRLDERVYSTVPAISDFVQQDPREGEPATEKTEAWILFDDKNIYVSARCWDSQPERGIANEMRRDSGGIFQNESFGVVFDTFHDKRNSVLFQSNMLGGLMDGAATDERDWNADWNTVWDSRIARFENGWTIEIVIPFKSLRYSPGPNQVWGVNLRRTVRWKNETSYLTRMPSFLNMPAILRVSLGATMVGLDVPSTGKNLEFKPYGISSVRSDRNAKPAVSNKADGDFGFDLKYGVTKSLTADFTYNTDFAQVEDDQQQVNLTRFSLFFPEKRDFFLEGRGIFAFGGVGTLGANAGPDNTPVMFFSRRIGLNSGRQVPITGGGRMTGKAGKYAIGVLNIQSDDEPISATRATNFTVLRMKRDFMGRSNVGAIYTRRSIATIGAGASETFGVDALYSFSPSLNINTYLARTRTPGSTGDDTSYLGRFDYNADRYGAQVEHLLVGTNFNPEVGFLRRRDFRRSFAQLRFSPRPNRARMKRIRKFNYQGSFDTFTNKAGRLDTREAQGDFGIDFQNGDRFGLQYSRNFEFIPQPFAISSGVTVPIGGYSYEFVQTSYTLGAQHKVGGQLLYERGSLYDGIKQTLAYSRGRIEVSPQLSVEPSVSLNQVDLPWGEFTATVVSTRSTFTVTPRMFVSALIQYNSSAGALSSNVRMRWEYQPGSELFVVYSDGRDTLNKGFPDLTNRAFIVKINRLFRF